MIYNSLKETQERVHCNNSRWLEKKIFFIRNSFVSNLLFSHSVI